MLYVVAGDLGSGKTLHVMMMMMMEKFQAGVPIYTNIDLLPACPFYDHAVRLDDTDGLYSILQKGEKGEKYKAWWHYVMPQCMVVIDEADLWFDSADHGKMGDDVKGFHKMLRKVDVDVVLIVQNISNLYVRLRRLAQRFIICEHNYRVMRLFRWLPIRFSSFFRTEFVDEELFDERGTVRISYAEASQYFGWFRTKQLVGNLSMYNNPYFSLSRCVPCNLDGWTCYRSCPNCGREYDDFSAKFGEAADFSGVGGRSAVAALSSS